jgi:penicillin-insensitive murein DD-endopeptidase
VSFKELPVSRGLAFNNRTPDSHWGKPEVIDSLVKIGKLWADKHDSAISVGQISRKLGGSFPPHHTHRDGDDVDIRPMRTDKQNLPTTWKAPEYSRDLTREMIKTIRANAPIRSILFNDPALIREKICQAYLGHDNHLHVNFMAAPKVISRSTLRRGDTGTAVQDLQRKLGIRADGNFGPDTLHAVREFQAHHNLRVDGIFGPASWAVMDRPGEAEELLKFREDE